MVRMFALIIGVVYIAAGALGFIPAALTTPGGPDLAVDTGYGRLLGLFPVNILHNIVHLAIGLWGVLAYKSVAGSIAFARGLAIVYAILGVAGLIPGLNTLFGLVPLFGNDVWLHLATAAVAAYFGWVARPATTSAV